ncbi:MAG: flagellar basal body P-ring protein FlgI [Planctomycetaceae bacterium]|nr:flagellar basal body P-ring protein FlgI [Planctomycetaceae bacterium]
MNVAQKNPSHRRHTPRMLSAVVGAMYLLAGDTVADRLLMSSVLAQSPQVRIKDVTDIAGEHQNDLVGYGLVVGLAGTGGTSESTKRAAVESLQKLGLRADPQVRAIIQQAREKTNNISVVMVTAKLPPYAKPGQKIDVIVAAFDDAESLNGGLLLRTPLKGVDGEVYAVASGPVSLNGGTFGGQGATVSKNHPTTGRVANGAVIEAEVPTTIIHQGYFHLLLRQPEVRTAMEIAGTVNQVAPETATIVDPGMVTIRIPEQSIYQPFDFISTCLDLSITPATPAKVTINERTGTVVLTESVRISAVAITHGNLIVSVTETPEVSQPAPFSQGETTTVPRTDAAVTEEQRAINVIPTSTTVAELAASLNALGVTPRDLSSILQMLKESGALHAELEIK